MLAPYGAPPLRDERICFFQVEVLDAAGTKIGVINTDAMALALQEYGFAVLDTKQEKSLTFGQALFFMKQGKSVKLKDQIFYLSQDLLVVEDGELKTGLSHVPMYLLLDTNWELAKDHNRLVPEL